MSRELIEIKHHLASGCCMWSGIEDIYVTRTKKKVPEAFLFTLSSFGEAVYLKKKDEHRPIMFSVGDGRTRKTYDRIKDVLGLTYKISEGRTVDYALKTTKAEIDKGNPVILGPLDMYHLPYLRRYHKEHIPMHYILMVGYDEEKKCRLIYDCDRENLIELPEEELINAWQIDKNEVGDKNGFIRFSLPQEPIDPYELAKLCIQDKAKRQLCKKPSFVGVNAYYKIAKELDTWTSTYSRDEYLAILRSLTEFFGRVPKIPNQLLGIHDEEDILYQGNFDRVGLVLSTLGKEHKKNNWIKSGSLFMECGILIEQITNAIIKIYLDIAEDSKKIKVAKDDFEAKNTQVVQPSISARFIQLGDTVQKAYQLLSQTSN